MSTTPVSGSGGSGTSSATYASGNPNSTLTQADFLQIMVAQFENQDPLSSGGDSGGSSGTSDYVEELMSMTNITTMQTMSQQQSMQLASSLPGSTVTLNNNGTAVSGQVTGAAIENATLYVTVNGTQYPATDLVSVTESQAEAIAAAQIAAASGSGGSGTGTN
jgi:flagellar basal-body rod modification protein FlgD